MSDASPTEFPKRFYKAAATAEIDGGWTVALDGRGLKTPEKAPLALPTKALAEAIAKEWEGQGERIHIASMHLTRLANVAIDRTPKNRSAMADELARYCQTDLLCHLAGSPQDLCDQQDAAWAPVRIWAGKSLGILLVPVEGIIASPQPDASLEAAKTHALGLDDFRLTGLSYACGLFGSALLALAVEQGEIDALGAFERTLVDEKYQMERWGTDAEAEARIAGHRREAANVKVWFDSMDAVSADN